MSTYILVPGLWIGAWAWHDVTAALRGAGHEVFPMSLTGVADRAHLAGPDVDLDTHIEDIVRLAEIEDLHDVVLVGHSYGGLPVSAAALRLRDRIRAVVYVDSGPLPIGTSQLDMGPVDDADLGGDTMPPREWDPAADPQMLAGLDEHALDLLRTRSTPHPMAAIRQPLQARATAEDLPTVLIASTFPLDVIAEMKAAGHPFFAGLGDAPIISVPTGHWPMLSEPVALAEALQKI